MIASDVPRLEIMALPEADILSPGVSRIQSGILLLPRPRHTAPAQEATVATRGRPVIVSCRMRLGRAELNEPRFETNTLFLSASSCGTIPLLSPKSRSRSWRVSSFAIQCRSRPSVGPSNVYEETFASGVEKNRMLNMPARLNCSKNSALAFR